MMKVFQTDIVLLLQYSKLNTKTKYMNGAEIAFIAMILIILALINLLLQSTDNKDEDDNDHDFWNDNKNWGV